MPLAILLVCYLLGSLNFSYLLPKWLRGVDIRDHGSGNAGATNASRVVGGQIALVAGLLDLVKGAVAGALAGGSEWLTFGAGLAVIAGHNWPIFMNFKGGKGVATGLGLFTFLAPVSSLLSLIVGIFCWRASGVVALGSLAYHFALVTLALFFIDSFPVFLLMCVALLLSCWSHRENIRAFLQQNGSSVRG